MAEQKSAEKNNYFSWKSEFGWAQVVAIGAAVISVIMPIVGYLYFSPKLEEQKNELAELRDELKNRPELFVSKPKESMGGKKDSLEFEVTNVGQYAAKELQIIIWTTAWDELSKASDKKEAIRNHVMVAPNIQYEPELEGGVIPIIRLTFKKPLAPKEKLLVVIFEIPTSVKLQNQYGDLIPVFASGGI